jgi:hypothetical protein
VYTVTSTQRGFPSGHTAPPQGGAFDSHTHACEVYNIPPFKTLLAHPWPEAGQPAGSHRSSTEREARWSTGSSCELLRSLDAASGSVHCCEVPCRTLRSISTGGDVQDVLLGFASLRELTERTRETSRWVRVDGKARTCCDSHLHCCDKAKARDTDLVRLGSSHPTPHPEQTHPQSSRYTPRCPSVVLWTLCSGVEWGVRTDHQGLEKRHDGQVACEPAGGDCRQVPDHHSRLHTHRTSPAQALLTILTETCCNV